MPWREGPGGDPASRRPAAWSLDLAWDALFERSPTPKLLLAATGTVAAMNAAWMALSGLDSARKRGARAEDISALADQQLGQLAGSGQLQRALAGASVHCDLVRFEAEPATDGGPRPVRYVEASYTPLGVGAAFRGLVLATFADVTRREVASQAARDREVQLRTVIDNAPALIFLKSLDHRFILANQEVARIFGLEDLEGRYDSEFFSAEELAGLHAWDNKIIAGGVTQRLQETLSTPQGPRHFLTVKFPIRNNAGDIVGIGGISQDETDRVVAEEDNRRLQVSEKAAREANKLKSDFLATISHEIRTPLAGIIGLTHLLLDTVVDPEPRRHLASLEGAAQMLLHVLNDILDLSKLEAKKFSFAPRPFAVRAMVGSCHTTLLAAAQARGLTLVTAVDEQVPTYAVGDAARLGQVLLNLVNNAIKFSERGRIVVHVRREPGAPGAGRQRLRFAVSDQGIGIRAEDRQRLFRSFSQADGSIARRFGGTGLGLAISRAIVEAMDGTIDVDSTPGQGSTFWFVVPAPHSGEVAAADQEHRPPAPAVTPLCGRVLVAEDNLVNQTVVLRLLKKLGLDADLAADGAAACALADRQRYDVILMDCHMPGCDGFQATSMIRAHADGARARVPIVAVTANALAGERERCLAAGMSDYLTKPVTLDGLHACLRRYLAARPDGADSAPSSG